MTGVGRQSERQQNVRSAGCACRKHPVTLLLPGFARLTRLKGQFRSIHEGHGRYNVNRTNDSVVFQHPRAILSRVSKHSKGIRRCYILAEVLPQHPVLAAPIGGVVILCSHRALGHV